MAYFGGTSGNDSLDGTSEDDVFDGHDGDDVVTGGGGNDQFFGGAGSDTLVVLGAYEAYTITRPNPNETWLVNAATLENVGIVGVDFVQFTDVTVAVGDLAAHLAYTGTDGDDSLDGAGLDDTLEGGGGNDTINGLAGNDLITGGAGNDSLNGGEGSDTVDGGAGNDTLVVQGNYADYVIGLYGDTGGRLLENAGTNEQIFISDVEFVQFADVSVPYADLALQGTAGNDFLVGSTGNDVMRGLAGEDTLVGKEGDDTIDGGEGYDSVYYAEATAGVNIHLVSGGGATDGLGGSDVLRSIEGILGSAYDDTLTGAGTAGGETFEGYGGNDSINGQGGGMDWVAYSYSPGGVNVDLAAGTAADGWGCTDTLAGIEAVRGSADDDTLTGDGGANRLEGQDGSDSLYGGGGNDTLDGGTGSNFIDGGAGVDTVVLSGTQGNFEVYQYSMTLLMFTNVSTGDQVTVKNVEFLEFADGTGAFSDFMSPDPEMNVSGGPWEDNIVGAGSNDMLHGNDGNDTLDGQGGDDLLDGGAGYDLALYGFAEAGVNVNLATTLATGGGGNDTLTGVEQVNGSEFADTLTGDAAANHFQGLGGNDTLNGGDGNDTLVGGAGSDSIGGGNGIDRAEFWGDGVESGVTVNLATGAVTGAAGNDTLSGIENVVGTDYADSLAGSTLANELVGGLGDDTLNGGTGNDTLDGGEGSDWVQFAGATTAVTANLATGATTGGAGVDLLTSIENAAGSSFNDSIVGSSEGNILRGEAGNDTLNGGTGNDTLAGGAGNDSLVGGSGIDTADYSEATGTVTVNLSVANQTTGGAGNDVLSGIENVRGGNFNDTLTGSTGANLLAGGGGRDSIAGGAGADTLWGGVGNDTLDGGTVSDRVNYSDGNALVYGDSTAAVHVNLSGISGTGSTGTGTVQDGLGGTDTVSNVQFITGSAFDDTITGSGARIFEQIEGGAGNDTLDGGAQNDALNQTDGNSVSYADAPNAVEVNLWDGYAWDGTWLDTLVNFNQVRGSSFDDTLAGTDRTDYTEHFEGRAGSDIIEGYGGFDILRYDNAPSAVSVALETGVANDGEEGLDGFAGIEGVYGSSFDDFLFGGNSSSDALEVFRGGAGNDFIDGGGGFDRVDYASSTAGVNVALADGEYGTASDGLGGTDTLGSIEAVRGSAFNDTLAGAGADFESFEGGAGNDTINGYGGQDIADYDHSTAGVNVNLATGVATDGLGGTDTLLDIESVLGSRLANDTITGGAGNDTLFGQGGNDSLNGGGGNDWLYAGTGVDTVDGGAGDEDVVVVPGAPGNYSVSRPNATDTVLVGGTTGENITLRNVEYVQFNEGAVPVGDLWGNAATTGDDFLTGYEGDDSIDGLAGNDTINGLPGNDTIIGGSGNDSLLGGGDNDLYVVDVAGDQVVENEGEGIDTVNVAYASALTYTLGAFVENAVVTSAAGIAVNLAGNELDNQLTGNTAGNTLTGNDGNDTLNGGAGNDTMIGGAGDDTYVVNVAADVVNETLGGSGTDTVNVSFTTGVTYTLGAGLENALVGNSVAGINLTGNALGNMLEGSDMANILAGGVGNDILSGNSGNDTLQGNEGADVMVGGAGNDSIDGGAVLDRVSYTDGNLVSYGTSTAGIQMNLAGITGNGGTGSGTVIDGLGGTDTVANVQFIVGSAHNDSFIGSAATVFETFEGGDGDDTINGGLITDTLKLTNSNLVVYSDAWDAVQVDLATGSATGGAGSDVLSNINQVRGSSYSDVLAGSDRTDVMEQFEGAAGDDLIDGRGGYDLVSYKYFANEGVQVNFATGNASDGQGGLDTVVNMEGVAGSDYADNLDGGNTDNDALEFFRGEGGDDTINGAGGFDRADYTTSTAGVNVTLNDTDVGSASDGLGGTDSLVSIEAVRGSNFNDTLTGSDTAEFESFQGMAGADKIDGKGGIDQADYSMSTAGVFVNLGGGGVLDGWGSMDTVVGVEWARGSRDFNDMLIGSGADNKLEGQGGNDDIAAGGGDDTLDAGTGVDTVNGEAGTDTLVLLGAYDAYTVLRPAEGDTRLVNLATGEDILLRLVETIQFTDGAKTVNEVWGNHVSNFDDVYLGTEGDDSIDGMGGADSLTTLGGNDTIIGGGGVDTMTGGEGNDTYTVDTNADVMVEAEAQGTDTLNVAFTAAGTFLLGEHFENAIATAAATVAVNIFGNDVANWLGGNGAANLLIGGAGNDTLDGGAGSDTLAGGTGDDSYVVNVATDVVNELASGGSDGNDTVNVQFTAAGTYTMTGGVENAVIANGLAGVNITGSAGDDSITGNIQANLLNGGAGNDTFHWSLGADTVDGGTGSEDVLALYDSFDAYTITRLTATDTRLVNAGTGENIVFRNLDFIRFGEETKSVAEVWGNTLSAFDDIYTGTEGDDSIDGMGGADSLTALGGNDTIIGGTGNDTMVGGEGDDTYTVDTAVDVVVEAEGQGTDTVDVAFTAAGTYVLGDHVENGAVASAAIVATNITGNDLPNQLNGNGAANVLAGGAGNDTLDGGAGSDTLAGGAGDDSYIVNVATDVVNETAPGSDGSDTVSVLFTIAGTYTMTAGVENAIIANELAGVNITGSAGDDSITGNNQANLLNGGAGNDTFDAGTGADTVDGGTGSADVLVVPGLLADYTITRITSSDTRLLNIGTGENIVVRNIDSIEFADGAKTQAEIWGNSLTALDDIYTGTADGDVIDGLAGNDSLMGLQGGDILIGGLGNDTMLGGPGNDSYAVNVASDVVIEAEGEGADEVYVGYLAAGTYTLPANIERATVLPTNGTLAVHLVGNELGNFLTGNAGNNAITGGAGDDTLWGGLGNDIMAGGAGNDSYILSAVADVVNETAPGSDGLDEVSLMFTRSGTYVLPVGVENATVNTSLFAVNITGNASANLLSGKGLANTLLGMAGDDTLAGGGGNDILDGGLGSDTVNVLGASTGYTVTRPNSADTLLVNLATSERVTIRNVEFVHFTDVTKDMGGLWGNTPGALPDFLVGTDGDNAINGLAGNDTITGYAGNDSLTGGLGNDSLVGGDGDDTYTVEVPADVVVEAAGQGTDTVNVAFTKTATYVLGANVERATAATASATLVVHLTGNELNNFLVGNAAANILTGGAGNDTLFGGLGNDVMIGGAGNDNYNVNSLGDVVNETAAGSDGFDAVGLQLTAAGTYVMPSGVEWTYIASGPSGINITGNASNNSIYGSNGSNTLLGLAGNDLLYGAGGIDFIDGGADTDTLLLKGLQADFVVTQPAAGQTRLAWGTVQVTLQNVEYVYFEDEGVTVAVADLVGVSAASDPP